MAKLRKFSEIEQLKGLIYFIRQRHDYKGKDENEDPIYVHTTPYPVITLEGTVKLHGTNAGIGKYRETGEVIVYQSRENFITPEKDNAGFARVMSSKPLEKLFAMLPTEYADHIIVYGEWLGKGINKGVAINELEKCFVIFAVVIDDVYQDMKNYKHLKMPEERIFNILDFKTYEITIDFNCPEAIEDYRKEITISVEDECPFAKEFGVSGVGEGIVFVGEYNGERIVFKTKGEKHQKGGSKPKPVNDRVGLLQQVAEEVTPEWRLEQFVVAVCDLNNGGQLDMKKMGDYLKAVVADIEKECQLTLQENGVTMKELNAYVSNIARVYFKNRPI